MSKYTYKRDDTPDVSGCGFVLVLLLALHGFCMYLCFRGRIETRNKYIGHDPIDGWFCWNAHTHMYWRTMDKNGRIFTAYLVATLRNETDRDIQYCVVRLLVCVTGRRITWMTIRERFLNVSVFSSMLKVFCLSVWVLRLFRADLTFVFQLCDVSFFVCILVDLVYISSKCYQH